MNATVRGIPKTLAFCRSSGKGTPYVGIVADCFTSDTNEPLGTFAGEMYITDATKQATAEGLKSIGWGGDTDDAGGLIGPFKTVDMGLIEDTYNGKTRTRIDWVGAPKFSVDIRGKDRLKLSEAKLIQSELKAAMGLPGF